MNAKIPHSDPLAVFTLRVLGVCLLLLFLWTSSFSQNTKGDKPVKNQRQVRDTKAKSYKKKERGRTKDIAGRRLRTKGQSSANRANASYPQPTPYQNRNNKQAERPARPLGRVFTKSPRESKVRAWKGDVSGYPLKRMKPSGSEASRNNVYPQKGPYVRFARKQPKKKPPVYSQTIKGRPFAQHEPRRIERAWKGGADGGPIKNQSISGSIKNVYPQQGPYVAHYRKNQRKKQRSFSNTSEVSRAKRLSRVPKTGGTQGNISPSSASRPFIQRGRKNVYWGKFSKKERPVTTDITGGPLRTRNYKTFPPGLLGRDTLKFFGRKPFGDRSNKVPAGGFRTATKKGQRGWKGDVSGYKLRKSQGKNPYVQTHPNPVIPPGQGGIWLEKIFNKKFKGVKPGKGAGGSISAQWNNNGQPVGVRRGGLGSLKGAGYQGNIKSYGKGKTFGDQGTGSSGNIRREGASKSFSDAGLGYSGNTKRSRSRVFDNRGAGYAGNVRRNRTFGEQGANYSGNIRRSRVLSFDKQGAGYAGNIKSKRSGISRSAAQAGRYKGNIRGGVKTFEDEGTGYSGNIKRSSQREFGNDWVGYSGTYKSKRQPKGGGSVSGRLWNNNRQSVSRNRMSPAGVAAARYSGNIPSIGEGKIFDNSAAGYSGNIKRSNVREFERQGAGYAGNIKAKRPEKGGGSVSGILWNNNNKAIPSRTPLSKQGIDFAGNIKYKKPEKGGGSVSGKLWNNDNKAIAVKLPAAGGAKAGEYSGSIALSRFRKHYVQNPNASNLSVKKQRPDATTYQVAGLQVKVHQRDYKKKPNANVMAMKGVAPTKASVKASEYYRLMKEYRNIKHNPRSADDALPGIAPGRAMARIGDFQGNVKMHKYSGSRLHPDAQFAHGFRDNVKEERTLLMNVKLAWGKLFRKNETQPENLKEKNTRPRYDKREKGMWNE